MDSTCPRLSLAWLLRPWLPSSCLTSRLLLFGLALWVAALAAWPRDVRANDPVPLAGSDIVPKAWLIPSCARTRGGIAIAEPRGRIYYCLQRVVAIERRYPGASKFFILHEYGHIALQTGDELRVDCWSAWELAHTPGGADVMASAQNYLEQYKLPDPKYGGTGADRSELLAGCFAEGMAWLDRAREEGRRPPPILEPATR